MDAMWTLRLVQLGDFSFAHDHTAHPRADNDADPPRIFFRHLQAGIRQGFLGGDQCKLSIPVHPLGLYAVEISFWREPMDLSCDLRAVAVHGKWVEVRNRRDSRPAVQRCLPEFADPDTDGSDHS